MTGGPVPRELARVNREIAYVKKREQKEKRNTLNGGVNFASFYNGNFFDSLYELCGGLFMPSYCWIRGCLRIEGNDIGSVKLDRIGKKESASSRVSLHLKIRDFTDWIWKTTLAERTDLRKCNFNLRLGNLVLCGSRKRKQRRITRLHGLLDSCRLLSTRFQEHNL